MIIYCFREWVTTNAGCPLCKEPISSEGKAHKRFYQNINPNAAEGEEANSFEENEVQTGEPKTTSINKESSNIKTILPKQSPELKKYKTYMNMLKTLNWIENSPEMDDESNIKADTGAVSYALPCQAIYSRSVKNEIKRLEIEIYNKKLLEMYDNPGQALLQYEDDLVKIKNKINTENI